MYDERWNRKQTRLKIKSEEKKGIEAAIEESKRARKNLNDIIIENPDFRSSLEPLSLHPDNYPPVISEMLKSSRIARVGPFAAVAGSISQIAKDSAVKAGAENILVDNGGDMAIDGVKEFKVGIYAGESTASGRFSFSLEKGDLPVGICTSSGTVGHSLSFGESDAVVVVSKKASVSDAAATSVGNAVKGEDVESSVKEGLDRADDIGRIDGCLIIRDGHVGRIGSLPEIFSMPDDSRAYPEDLTMDGSNLLE